jgi:hypothetical protein
MQYLPRIYLIIGLALSTAAARLPARSARPPSSPIAIIPFETANKNIYLRVAVAGRPLWFVLDTGDKYTVIDLAAAKALKLELGDPVPVGGGGDKQVIGNLMKSGAVVIPELNGLALPVFIGVPFTDIANASGHEFAGILGFDFINKYVIKIDYQRHRLTLYNPDTYRYDGSGESLPLTFNASGHPQLRAQILDGRKPPIDGLFVLDIGSGATLILNRPFVEAQQFLVGRRTVPWLTGLAFGGGVEGRVGRLTGVKIGHVTIPNPIAIFTQARQGAFSTAEAQGNIGAAILEKFTLTLDYPHGRIFFQPTGALAKPMDYDKSGLMLVSLGGDYRSYKVDAVADDSPASEAGIRPGDQVVLIEGKRAGTRSLSTLREMLQKRAPFRLTLEREGRRFSVVLRPRRMI